MAHLAALLEQIEIPGSPFVTLYTYIVAAGCWAWPPCSLFPASSVFLSLGLAELLEKRDICDICLSADCCYCIIVYCLV